ncbi:MAG: V-type ATPase 116kDa subunit family protein, partial [Candidatus Bathyarchaeia archaeon]
MLKTERMARLEVVAPAAEIDQIIHNLGKLEIAQFININALKEEKYKPVAEEVKRSPREDQLQQLTNRLSSTMKKLGDIPEPEPISLKENATELLKQIDVETQTLEVEVARIENEMKNLLEERASAERETIRFQEELESSRRFFQDLGPYQSSLDDTSTQMFRHKDEIRQIYARLLDVQKTLSTIDAAAKLQPNQGNLSNNEGHIKNLSENLQKTRILHEKLRGSGTVTKENLGYLDSFIREVGEAIDRKSDSISRLTALKSEASALLNDINNLKQTLPQFAGRFVGEAFQGKLLQTLDSITKLNFDSQEIEELAHRVGQHTYDVLRIAESLENVERFIGLQRVETLLDKIRSQSATGIDNLLHGYEDLVRKVPGHHLKIVERSLRTFYMEKKVEELADLPKQLSSRLEAVGTTSKKIHVYREIVEIELRIEDMKKFFRQTSKTNVFEVWVKKSDADRVMAEVRSSSPGSTVVATGEEKGDRPPSAMRFPKLMTAYAKLTGGYGVPNYRELDPTMITIFTFPVLFGLMFGDIGQGAIVLIGGFLIRPIFKRLKVSGPLWDPLVQGRNIIITCGMMA